MRIIQSHRPSPVVGLIPLLTVSLVAGSLVATLTGCVNVPSSRKEKERVFAAARQVLQERYPLVSESESYDQLYASSGVELFGNQKSRRQISVVVRRSFLGIYEPLVAVQQYIEDAEGPMSGNPESVRVSQNPVIGAQRWRPLERLPLEEQSIYEAIMEKARAQEI